MSSGNLDALSAIATVLNPNMEEYHEDGVEHETIIVTSADGQILEEAYIITSEPREVKDTGQELQEETEAETFCDLDESTKEAGQQLQQRLIKEELKAAWEQELAANGFVVCSVPGCSMKYSTIVSFEGHYKWCTGENGEGVETCEYCNCQFLTCLQGIEDHVKEEHPSEINDYCAKRVARKIIKECREKEQKAKELKEAKALNLKRGRQVARNSYQRRQTCYSKKSPVINKSDSDNSKDGADKKVRFHKAVSVIHTEKQEGDEDVDDPGTIVVKEKPKKGQPPKKETEVLQLARNWGVQRKTYSRSGPSTDCPPGSKDIFGPEFEAISSDSALPTQDTATTTAVTRSVTAPITEKIDETVVIETNSLQVPVEVPATTSEVDQQSDQIVTFLNEDDDGNIMIPIETEGCITVGDEAQENEENYQLVIVTGESGESQYIVIDDSISQALADGTVSLDDNNELQVSENSCFNVVTSNVETYNSAVDEIEVAAEEYTNENDLETVQMDVEESNTIVLPEPSDPVITLPVKATKKVVFVEPKLDETVHDDLISTMPTADKWVEENRKSVENKKILVRKRKVKPTQLESGSDDSDLTVDRFQLQTPTNLPSINIGDDFLPPNLNKLLEFGSGRSDKNKSDLSSSEGSTSPSSNRKDINGSWVEPKNSTPIYQKSLIRNTPIILKNTVPSLQPTIAVKSVIHHPKSKAIEVPVPITTKNVVTDQKNTVTEPKSVVTEPKSIVAEPKSVVAEPKSIVTEPKSIVAEPKSVVTEPQSVVTESKSVVAEPKNLVTEPKSLGTEPQIVLESTVVKKDLPLSEKIITKVSDVHQTSSMIEKDLPIGKDTESEKVEKTNASEVKKTSIVKETTAKIDSPLTVMRENQEDDEIPMEISSQHQEESRASNTSESSSITTHLKSDSGFSSYHDLTGLTGNPHIKIYTPNSDGTLAPLEDFSILSSNPQIRIMTPETDGTLKPMIIGDKDLILKTVQKMIATGSSSGTLKTHDNKISVLPEASEKNNGQPREIDIGTTPISLEETNSSLLNEDNNSRTAIEPLSASEEPTTISMPEVPSLKNEELIRIENELLKGYSTPTRMDYEEVVTVDSSAVATTKIVDTPIKRKRGRPPRVDSAKTSTTITDVTRINNSNSTPPRKIFKPNVKSQEAKLTLSHSDLSSQIDTTMDESLSNDFGNLKNNLSVASETRLINTSFTSVLDSVSDSDSNLPPARRGGPAMRGGRWARRRAGKRGRPFGRGRKPAEPSFEPESQALDDDEDEADSYQCSACQLVFDSQVVGTNHIISKHNGLARLNDDTPLTSTEISYALRMVLKRKRSLVCLNEDCRKVFRSGPGYLNHTKMCGVEIKMVTCQVCKEEIMEPKFNAHYLKHIKESKRKSQASDTEDGNEDESRNGVPKLKKRTTRRAALMANSRLEEFVKAERIDEDGKEILSDSDHERVEEGQQSESEVGKVDPKDKIYTVEEEETEKSDYSPDASADETPQTPIFRPQEWYRNKLEKDWPDKYRKPVEKTIELQQKQNWKTQLQQNKYINCKNEGCNKRLLSITACVKHQKLCGDDACYICLLCRTERPFKHKAIRKFYYHILKHKTTTSGDAPAKPIGYRKYFPSPNILRNTRGSNKNLQVNPKLTKYAFNFCENHHLAENYSGFRPLRSDWMLVRNPDDYLPKERESLNFKVRRLNDDTSSSWSKLKIFEVFESKSEPVEHITFNAGGPVWASAWCPTPLTEAASKETEQYAAVSISLDLDNSHYMTDITRNKGLIEIWNFGNLNQKILKSTPRLVLAIGHSYGEIRDMKWCPSGCWDHPLETVTTPEVLPRLGLLALACGDGCVRVLSIPHPELLDHSLSKNSQNTSKIYVTNPVFLMNPPESGLVSTSQKTCVTSIAFEKTDGHGKLAAGYGNGLVSLWDLRSNSPLIVACRRRPASKGCAPSPQTLRPFHIFQAHSASVTSVAFSPVPNGRFLATCGFDRVSKIWDLDDTSVPTDSYRKYLGRDISWSCHWAGYFMAVDEGFTVQSVNTIFKECGYFDVGTASISNHNSCIWKTSVSDWLNCEATCDVAGTVNMTIIPNLSQNILNLKSLKGLRWPIYTTQVCSLLEDTTSSPGQSGTPKKGGKSKLAIKNDPSLFLYNTRDKITQNYGIVFIDAPLSSYNQLSSPEARSLTSLENIPHLYPGQFQIASVNNVSWNPNLGSHQWLLTAGQSGLVRLSCFSALKLPTINRLLAKVTKDNERT